MRPPATRRSPSGIRRARGSDRTATGLTGGFAGTLLAGDAVLTAVGAAGAGAGDGAVAVAVAAVGLRRARTRRAVTLRSEERRVGIECRCRWSTDVGSMWRVMDD